MGTIHYDNSLAPVYVVSFEGTPTRIEFARYLDYLSAILARGERYALIVDASAAAGLPGNLRRMQAAWIKANARAIERLCVGTAFVILRSFVYRILAAILMRHPIPAPSITTEHLPSAVMWTAERLQQADIELPLGLMTRTAIPRSA